MFRPAIYCKDVEQRSKDGCRSEAPSKTQSSKLEERKMLDWPTASSSERRNGRSLTSEAVEVNTPKPQMKAGIEVLGKLVCSGWLVYCVQVSMDGGFHGAHSALQSSTWLKHFVSGKRATSREKVKVRVVISAPGADCSRSSVIRSSYTSTIEYS